MVTDHPKGLWVILCVELWERFSYYGMRALLMLYMVSELNFDTRLAGSVYGLYTALAYLTPILGGIWADSYVGQRRAIRLGALLMAAGHLVMIINNLTCFFSALVLVVIGTGLFKANTAVLVGKLYPSGDRRRDAGFGLFYLTVNIGAALAPLVCGTLAQHGRWHMGFGAAGLGMLLGLGAFRRYEPLLGDVGLAPEAAEKKAEVQPKKALSPMERDRMWALVILALAGNVILWAALSQNGSSMALFAARHTNLVLPYVGFAIPASYMQAVGPTFIVVGVPLSGYVWRRLARGGCEPSSPGKFVIGLTLVSMAFVLLSLAGSRADAGAKVSLLWLFCASLCATLGELCVSPVGLSLVTKLSPVRYASALMGVWYASMALANWLGGEVAGLYDHVGKAELFGLVALMTGGSGLLLMFLRRPVLRLMHGIV